MIQVSMANPLHFSTTDDVVWIRRLHGLERLGACISDEGEGFCHFDCGASISLPFTSLTQWKLSGAIRRAWARLRHAVPLIACRTLAEGNREYILLYTVPQSGAEVDRWLDETIKWHDGTMDLVERDLALKDTVWWTPSFCRYTVFLHVSPGRDGQWNFMLISGHWSMDGRGALQIMDKLFMFLLEELADGHDTLLDLRWGEETMRLAPAPSQALEDSTATLKNPLKVEVRRTISATGPAEEQVTLITPTLLDLSDEEVHEITESDSPTKERTASSTSTLVDCSNEEVHETNEVTDIAKETPITPPRIFFRPLTLDSPAPSSFLNHRSLAYPISLNVEETTAFRNACRSHGYTVTAVLNVLLALSELETSLSLAIESGDENMYREVIDSYKNSALFLIPMNSVDQRYLLSTHHASHSAEGGSPGFVLGGLPIMMDMDVIRKAASLIDGDGKASIVRDLSKEVFWEGVVANSADMLRASKASLCTPESYIASEDASSISLSSLSPQAYQIPAVTSSSSGDLLQLGLFSQWSKRNRLSDDSDPASSRRLVVEQVLLTVYTASFPLLMCTFWEWDGQATIHLQASAKWHTQAGLARFGETVRDWVRAVSN